MMTERSQPVPCVGGLVYDEQGRLLMIQRGNAPGRGRWAVPGGRVEHGETDEQALVREMAEETGLAVQPLHLIGRVIRAGFLISDYRCDALGGELRAGDDAAAARWCSRAELSALPLVDELWETLAGWQALPR